MSHVTRVESQRHVQRLNGNNNPGRVVNICFFIVLLLSTLLTWREAAVLQDAYVSSQRNTLENVVHEMNTRLQFSIDRLLFYRTGMQAALQSPLAFEVFGNAWQEFQEKRNDDGWIIAPDNQRALPLRGVSDTFVAQTTQLSRDTPLLSNELAAALEGGYLLRLTAAIKQENQKLLYISRAGFYITTHPETESTDNIMGQYYNLVTEPWFAGQSQDENPERGIRWASSMVDVQGEAQRRVALTLPVDYQSYWHGVLAMEFSVAQIQNFLATATRDEVDGEYRLYDKEMNLIAVTGSRVDPPLPLGEEEKTAIARSFEHDTLGGLHFATRYVNWEKMRNFDGVLVRVHRLDDGILGEFGTISIALGMLWLLFTTMLLISWGVIRRMVRNMTTLQESLQWQAWYDGLTRLYNRSVLFDLAGKAAIECAQQKQPISVIQLDLDFFKSINDRFGHQAGDRVLAHVAGIITAKVGSEDIAGRVGGEEFCIVMPDTDLEGASQLAERIRARINDRDILITKGTTLRVSASFGISCSEQNGLYDIEYLQSVADRRLYLAKQQGRNRVCNYDGEPNQ